MPTYINNGTSAIGKGNIVIPADGTPHESIVYFDTSKYTDLTETASTPYYQPIEYDYLIKPSDFTGGIYQFDIPYDEQDTKYIVINPLLKTSDFANPMDVYDGLYVRFNSSTATAVRLYATLTVGRLDGRYKKLFFEINGSLPSFDFRIHLQVINEIIKI